MSPGCNILAVFSLLEAGLLQLAFFSPLFERFCWISCGGHFVYQSILVALPALALFCVFPGVHGLVFSVLPPSTLTSLIEKWFGDTDFFFNKKGKTYPAIMSVIKQLGYLGIAGSRPGSFYTWP